MIGVLKNLAPFFVYVLGLAFCFMALTGRLKWPLAYLIVLLPLRNVVEKLQMFPGGKDLIDILLMSMLLGWIVNAMMNRHNFMELKALNFMAVVVVVYLFSSLCIGYGYSNYYAFFDPADPRVQSWKNFCILPLMFLLTFNNIHDKKSVWTLLLVMGATIVFMDLYQLRQISWYANIVSRTKIKGTFVHLGPNEIAAFYNMYTIIMISLFFAIRKKILKMGLGYLIWINLFCILFLYSRAAYIGLAVGMFFLFLIRKKILLVPLVLAVLFWQVALPEKVKARIEMTTDEYGELDKSNQGRLRVWEQSVELFRENPVTGVGFGVFRLMDYELGDTHNIYLKILAEQGLIGLFIFLLVVWLFFLEGVRLYSRGDDEISKALGLGLAIAVVVLLVNNMFGDRWTYMQVSSYLWITAALVCRLSVISDKAYKEKLLNERKRKAKKQYYGKPA